MTNFVHLQTRTMSSIMQSIVRVKELIGRAKELGQEAVAVTNTGNVYDAVEFYRAAKEEGIKPILGCEFSIVDDLKEKLRNTDTITILAMNNDGWTNLKKLITISNRDGFYRKPRISYDKLSEHADGLICLSGGINSRLSRRLVDEKIQEATEYCKNMKGVFGDRFYIQVMDTGIDGQPMIRKHSRDIARSLNIPVVATCDVHYIHQRDAYIHEVLLAISVGKKMSDPPKWEYFRGRPVFPSNEFWMKDYEDIKDTFTDSEILTTLEIAERCNVEITFDKIHLPQYPKLPDGKNSYQYLRYLVYEGFKRLGFTKDDQVYIDRMKEELKDIKYAGLADYFLIMWDWIVWAKNKGIAIGPGRGSCGGSLVAYCLQITDIDPIKYRLLWQRFYNRGRKGSLADIDTDVEIEYRDEILDYIRDTFGQDKVCQMITFGKLTTKNVLKDVGKAFDIPFDIMNDITSNVPFKTNTLAEALQESDKLQESKEKYKKIFTIAEQLEGIIKSRGSHAAAVVVSDENLSDGCIVLHWDAGNKKLVTGWDMRTLDDMKYLKLDLLGLKTLSVLKNTQMLVNKENEKVATIC